MMVGGKLKVNYGRYRKLSQCFGLINCEKAEEISDV